MQIIVNGTATLEVDFSRVGDIFRLSVSASQKKVDDFLQLFHSGDKITLTIPVQENREIGPLELLTTSTSNPDGSDIVYGSVSLRPWKESNANEGQEDVIAQMLFTLIQQIDKQQVEIEMLKRVLLDSHIVGDPSKFDPDLYFSRDEKLELTSDFAAALQDVLSKVTKK